LRRYRDIPTMTISVSSLASLARYGLRNLHLVPAGTTVVPLALKGKAAAPTVIFVGRLVANKRPQDALAAFAELRWRRPDAQLWVVGSGPLEQELRSAAPPGVTFFGKVSESRKFELMAQAHVLVATSRREGWGLIVTEAAAVGTPAVCYDVPGLRDSVAHSGGGRLVPCTPGALAAGLAVALDEVDRFSAIVPPSWDAAAGACMALVEDAVQRASRE
jgi:glycosyltransferase involved in cell wall biosynthesis